MPLLEDEPRRPTRFQKLVIAAGAKLDEILEAEGRALPMLGFGKKFWDDQTTAPRIAWMHVGGSFTLEANSTGGPVADEAAPPVPELGFRVAQTHLALWHVSAEHLEHMLDRLWLATTKIPGGEAFRWQTATYSYETERQGQSVQNGLSVITLVLPMELAVAGSFDGEIETVEIADTQIRTGIESPMGEDIGDTAYEVNSWVTPNVTSES